MILFQASKRGEITNASAFGNMELEKYLINFGD